MTAGQKKAIVITLALVIIVIFAGIWNFLVSKKLLTKPSGEAVQLSPEVLESLIPPPGAEPVELSPEVLKSLTPPPGAEPVELSPEVLRSLTP